MDAEAVDAGLIACMLERAGDAAAPEQPATPTAVMAGRFARDPDELAVTREAAG